tara:strand:+ start:565 stop:684 length:120 start_codon:yes stop_codon:yes gene_type:complete
VKSEIGGGKRATLGIERGEREREMPRVDFLSVRLASTWC